MRDLLHQFQFALICIVILLVISMCAIFTPAKHDLNKTARDNYINKSETAGMLINEFLEDSLQQMAALSHKKSTPTYSVFGDNTEIEYFAEATTLTNCIAAGRFVNGQLVALYGNKGLIKNIDIAQYYAEKPTISMFSSGALPFFIIFSPIVHNADIVAIDLAIYDPSPLLNPLKADGISYRIFPREDFPFIFNKMTKVGERLFEQNDKTYYLQILEHADAVLIADINNAVLYQDGRNAGIRFIIALIFSVVIITLLLYIFVYRQARQLITKLQNYNQELKKEKTKVEKLSHGQKDLFNILRSLNECWEFFELFRILNIALPYIVPYRNLLIAIRTSKTSQHFEIKEVTGDFLKYFPAGLSVGNNNLLERILLTGEPYFNGHLQEGQKDWVYNPEVNSAMIIPIISKSFKWGLIAIDHQEVNAFSRQDFELLDLLATSIALHLEEMDARKQLNNEAQRLRSLHDLVSKMAVERNKVVVSKLMTEIAADMHFLSLAVYSVFNDNDEPQFTLLSRTNDTNCYWEDIEPGNGTLEYIARSRTRQVQKIHPENYYQLMAPIIFRDDLYGVFQVIKEDDFNNQDIDTIQIMVNYLAIFWELDSFIKKAEQEALVDHLTMVWNRRYMMRQI
ncbi:MAG: GAF domain-containing protein, partial [Syntrophomonadaceae bacterium]|nr:GAF domain-containing protein [Syntrophomonadaceae bacterium]